MELLPLVRQRFFDGNGAPLSGGQVWTYAAGTTTPQVTYTDQSGTSSNTNPVILDANGYADIWIGGLSYKIVLQDALGVTLWTEDDIAIPGNSASLITFTHGLTDIAALKAIDSASRGDGLNVFVESVNKFFYFNSGASAAGDNITIVTPTAGSGRWIAVGANNVITGTRASPNLITAAGGIGFVGVGDRNTWFIKGNAAPITVTANPQIAAGTNVGQELRLFGTDDTNTVTLQDGTGLDLNGEWVGGNGSRLSLFWDGSNWSEESRR